MADRPKQEAMVVIWSRIDQNTCIKSIMTGVVARAGHVAVAYDS